MRLEWTETGNVEEMLLGLKRALDSGLPRYFGTVLNPFIRARIRDRFAMQGDEVTGAWDPLAEATVRARTSQGYGGYGPINKRTGKLLNYVARAPFQITPYGGGNWIYEQPGSPPGDDELYSKLRVAQVGSNNVNGIQRNPIPARPVLAVGPTDMAFTLSTLRAHLYAEMAAGA